MKKLLLTIPFLLIASCSTGSKEKIVSLNIRDEAIGEFNCTTGEFKLSEDKSGDFPLNKWLSKKDIVEIIVAGNEPLGSYTAEEVADMNYAILKDSVVGCE